MLGEERDPFRDTSQDFHGCRELATRVEHADPIAVGKTVPRGVRGVHPQGAAALDLKQAFGARGQLTRMEQRLSEHQCEGLAFVLALDLLPLAWNLVPVRQVAGVFSAEISL